MLSLADTDTEKFKAHSTRSTYALAAVPFAGITTDQISEADNWSSKSVFQQFYYKPTSSNAVGVSLLSAALIRSGIVHYSLFWSKLYIEARWPRPFIDTNRNDQMQEDMPLNDWAKIAD